MAEPEDEHVPDDDAAVRGPDHPDPDERQRRREVLAALCLAAAAAVLLYGISQALAVATAADEATGGLSGWELVETASGSSVFFPTSATGTTAHAMLVLAYVLLLVVGPAAPIGALGTRVLQLLTAVAALLVLTGAIIATRILRTPGFIEEGLIRPSFDGEMTNGSSPLVKVLERGGAALPVLVGVAIAAYVAWGAFRALSDWRPGGGAAAWAEDDDDLDPYGADAG